jgi:hypothetical protein
MKLIADINIKRCLCFVMALLLVAAANGQTSTEKIGDRFSRYAEKNLQEKLYMHVDKDFYLSGEIIWFKIYVTDASLHQPIAISKVGYVEVLDENNLPVLQTKISLAQGRGNGSLQIPVSINSGNYIIRGYTNWMKNAGADYFFEKKITLVNTQKNRERFSPATASVAAPDIRFFPEGGNLVTGISSRIACKVQGGDGKGIGYSGLIVDEKNDSITGFQAYKFGMGSFDFTPMAGHRYKAIIKTGTATYTRDLPEIFDRGYVMRLKANANAAIQITAQTNLRDTGTVLLLLHTRQSLKKVWQGKLQQGKAVFVVDPALLGEGISHFTMFNSVGQPLCERLHFTYPKQKLSIDIKGIQTAYPSRSAVDMLVETAIQNRPEKNTDLSIAVYRLDELQQSDDSNIEAFLWLQSDLRGRIESPAFYFNGSSEETLPAMDNLMLTQGWRRFKWEDILQEKSPASNFPPELNGHIITGKAVSAITGKPLENIETYISVPGLNTNFKTYISDTAGRLKFDFKYMKGSSEIIVQTNPTVDSVSRIELNNPFAEQFSGNTTPPFYLSSARQKTLLDQSINVQVQNQYAGTQLKRLLPAADTASVFEKPDAVYMMDDYTRFSTIEEVLREYVNLMDVQKIKGKFQIQLWNNFFVPRQDMANLQFFQSSPLLLVDGVPVFDIDRLMSYDPLKMRKLEVYNRRYFLGNSFFSGILNWTSYKGDLANFELDPRALVIDYEGLQLQREFYSPVYDSQENNAHTPDFRTLLYWSHEIPADKNGERHIRFYTSDKKGRYLTMIQGLSPQGYGGTAVQYFEIK